MYSINMSGKGLRYWICKIPLLEFSKFETLQKRLDIEYENIFFDLDILNKLGYSTFEDLFCIDKNRGFFITERNRIQIRNKTKSIKRFDSTDLKYTPLMFDPYTLIDDESEIIQETGFKYIALIQFETGTFFKFKLDNFQLNINLLKFHINYKPISIRLKKDFVTNISYENQQLAQKKEDVVCTGNQVIFL